MIRTTRLTSPRVDNEDDNGELIIIYLAINGQCLGDGPHTPPGKVTIGHHHRFIPEDQQKPTIHQQVPRAW